MRKNRLTPARVITDAATPTFLEDVVDIEVGYLGVCALKSNHTVWCWENHGNTSTNRATQLVVQAKSVTTANAVSMFDEDEIHVLTSDGKLSIVTPDTGSSASHQDIAVSCGP